MLEHLCDLGNAPYCISAAILTDTAELVVVQAAKKNRKTVRGG